MDYKLDVLVPTHNHLKLTMGCMDCLYTNTSQPFHLIVVDDSTDLTVKYFEELKETHDNVTFVHSDEPYKCGNQLFNVGMEHCKTPYMATVMNSVEVEPEWDSMPVKIMNNDPTVGTVGLKCLFPKSGLIECAGIYIQDYLPCDIGRDEPGHRLNGIYQCEATQWAFALHRVNALKGNLGENTYHGFVGVDDIDNCFTLRHKGWKIVYCGIGIGYHHARATRGKDGVDAYHLNRENLESFYKRWGYWESFHKSNPEVIETLKDVKLVASGDKMLAEELKEASVSYVRSSRKQTEK